MSYERPSRPNRKRLFGALPNNMNDRHGASLPSLGKPRTKKVLDKYDFLAVIASLICLGAASVTVSPATSVPWRFGVTRQFQVIGFLLSVMNQCFLSIAPQFLVLVEARFGPSYLQNYDAILRKSVTLSTTNFLWRLVLGILVILPIGLSLAYKEYDHGTGSYSVRNQTGSYYGMTAPAGLQESNTDGIGLSYMANATIAYYSATLDDAVMPTFPQAYGFNTLLLSNTSSAKLDGPFPEYVRSIQGKLNALESFLLTSDVNGTVTSYNSSIESHRNDDDFWNAYLEQMRVHWDDADEDINDDHHFASKLSAMDMYSGQKLHLLMNNLDVRNSSWCFIAFTSASGEGHKDSEAELDLTRKFKQNALLFHTRRERCRGTWSVTYNSIQLLNGTCDRPPLPDNTQTMFTNSTLAMPTFFMPSLVEYLGPFSDKRRGSPWLLPTFSTVLGGMYWSRVLLLSGYYAWKPSKTVYDDPDPNAQPSTNLYYLVEDEAVSVRATMNASPMLYLVLTVQPALTILFLIASLSMYTTPLDRGFGMIALLAGVRVETLKLLRGASLSGELKRSLRVRIAVRDALPDSEASHAQNEYIFGDDTPNDRLSERRHQQISDRNAIASSHRVPGLTPRPTYIREHTDSETRPILLRNFPT